MQLIIVYIIICVTVMAICRYVYKTISNPRPKCNCDMAKYKPSQNGKENPDSCLQSSCCDGCKLKSGCRYLT